MTDEITESVLGAAIEVHKTLGPGLLESVYEECLALEFKSRGLDFQRQLSLPIEYKGCTVNAAYRIDFLVKQSVILEIKAVEKLEPIHEAQILTYLKLLKIDRGLLINFNVPLLKNGIKRMVLNYQQTSAFSAPLR